ncbi:hypothetical protein O4H61_04580 [Roseovarius aestuarii]|nr:hypothetical protein [Roseovarius aestuarii]
MAEAGKTPFLDLGDTGVIHGQKAARLMCWFFELSKNFLQTMQ